MIEDTVQLSQDFHVINWEHKQFQISPFNGEISLLGLIWGHNCLQKYPISPLC